MNAGCQKIGCGQDGAPCSADTDCCLDMFCINGTCGG
jgi:hypothetical protein